jgi:ABC-type polar amino acid transport system ATPase subunit
MINATQISFGYDGKKIFDDVSLRLAPGTITALLGPSGAGKTTLLKCLAGLENPQSGTLGIDATTYNFPPPPTGNPPPPWPIATVVFQQLFLWPHLSLRDNILLPVRKHDPKETTAQLEQLCSWFDMAGFIDRFPNETSRGQQQRAALARALMLKPRYLFCDEITSALDVEQVAKVLTSLEQIKAQGVGVMLITHQLGFAHRAADQILFFDQGKIIEQGTPAILDTPQTPRLQEFLNLVKAAS